MYNQFFSMGDDIYVVEKILNRRETDDGQVEYYLKWFGYDETEASWEPEENIFCKDLIQQYEYKRKYLKIEIDLIEECRKLLNEICEKVEESTKICEVKNVEQIDFLSLEPERIVSITKSRSRGHELEFVLKCARHPKRLYFVSNEKAKELFPDLLIEFYERHINWFVDRTKIQRSQ